MVTAAACSEEATLAFSIKELRGTEHEVSRLNQHVHTSLPNEGGFVAHVCVFSLGVERDGWIAVQAFRRQNIFQQPQQPYAIGMKQGDNGRLSRALRRCEADASETLPAWYLRKARGTNTKHYAADMASA